MNFETKQLQSIKDSLKASCNEYYDYSIEQCIERDEIITLLDFILEVKNTISNFSDLDNYESKEEICDNSQDFLRKWE